MSTWNYGVAQTAGIQSIYPAYRLDFTYGGNSYTANIVLNTGSGAADSTDWDATVSAMVAALTSGAGYSAKTLYKFDVDVTVI